MKLIDNRELQCKNCGRRFLLRPALIGQQVRCRCGHVGAVPEPTTEIVELDEENVIDMRAVPLTTGCVVKRTLQIGLTLGILAFGAVGLSSIFIGWPKGLGWKHVAVIVVGCSTALTLIWNLPTEPHDPQSGR